MQTLAFTPERLEMFRSQVDATHPRSFDDVIRWYRRQCGVSYGEAKRRAIKSHAKLYNEFCSRVHRQVRSNTAARGSSSGSHTQVMSLREGRSGRPIIAFRGL